MTISEQRMKMKIQAIHSHSASHSVFLMLLLNSMVKLLGDNPDIEIEIGSHTDFRGPSRYNDLLSSRRAVSAVRYLISQGIDPSLLTWKGYGKTELVNECDGSKWCSEEKHQGNRRTEFKVTKIRNKVNE